MRTATFQSVSELSRQNDTYILCSITTDDPKKVVAASVHLTDRAWRAFRSFEVINFLAEEFIHAVEIYERSHNSLVP